MDRLARNPDDLRSIVRVLTVKKVRVHFVEEPRPFIAASSLDSGDP